MGIPYHLTCLLRNLYAGKEATVRTGHGTTDWFQIGKDSMSSLYIVAMLIYLICKVHQEKCWVGRSTAGLEISGRNIGNLRYADDTTLMPENEEELKGLKMKVK